jgi:TRAP-type uncharacterized transport system substrate-binding protein
MIRTDQAPLPPAPRRRRLVLPLVIVAVVAALAWMTVRVGSPFPPRTLVMATGPEGSAFREFGARYRQILRRSGVDLRLVETQGGVANLALLRDPASEVSVAFVEGGLTTRDKSPDLVVLGTVALEPLWVFFPARAPGTTAQKLLGKRIAVEPDGSGGALLARRILEMSGASERDITLIALTPEQGADALLRGEVDGTAMLTAWQSPALRGLLASDRVALEALPRADAYVALFPALDKIVLPAGAADLARGVPPADVSLVAARAELTVREGLHPALQYLLLAAASEIHGRPEVFHRAGRFPVPESFDLPLTDQARQYYQSGPPFAYRHLPFWLAGFAESLLIVLVPLLAVVYPVARILPAAYAFMIERRIYRLYGELETLERELETSGPTPAVQDRLASLASRANHLRVPLPFAQRLFFLRSHIAQAQQVVAKRLAPEATPVSIAP